MVYFSGWEGGWHVGVMELTHGHEFFLLSSRGWGLTRGCYGIDWHVGMNFFCCRCCWCCRQGDWWHVVMVTWREGGRGVGVDTWVLWN